MTSARIEVEGLSWGPSRAGPLLHPTSFAVAAGRVLAIVGANGAGKSTLLRLLYRFHRPRTGRVLIDGADIWQMSARNAARRIAAVLQEQPTDFALTVREIVALGRTPHRAALAAGGARDGAVIGGALARLGLAGFADRPFGTLSGGERQRVMVARALAQEPQVLILDEPTNHLDIRHQLEVLTLIRGLGLTVVTSLHDLNLASDYADDLLVLAAGHPLAFGTPSQVLTPALIARAFFVRAEREHLAPSGATRFTFHL